MNKTVSFLSWVSLALAIAAWGGIGYASMWLASTAQTRGASAQTAEQKAAEAAYQSRIKALAAETADERGRLEALANADIVTVANSIEEAGRSIGVNARVSTAIPSGTAKELPGGASLHGLAFIIQAEGSFSGLIQLVHVLQEFPGFSSVEQFELERVESSERNAQAWRTSIRLEIITTSDISS